MNNLAPIALFVYNRPEHTLRTLEALQKNELAEKSKLYIFSDGAKTPEDEPMVKAVRAICSEIKGFREIQLIEKEKNQGLANSIIAGVSKLFEDYEKLIIMEDDLLSSPFFLSYMNEALNTFKAEPKVWHISGWNYPIDTEGLNDAFLWRVMNCWGWGSWRDRWQHFEKNPQKLIETFSKAEIARFDLNGTSDFWEQVELNASGRFNTWAIFWYASIFQHNGLCLNPAESYILNIGLDGSGMHGKDDRGLLDSSLSKKFPLDLNIKIEEDKLAVKRVEKLLYSINRSLIGKVKRKLVKIFKLGS